jgi:hypothetical protein
MAVDSKYIHSAFVILGNHGGDGRNFDYFKSNFSNETDVFQFFLDFAGVRRFFGGDFDENRKFVEHIYRWTFDKTSAQDQTGIDYWTNNLNNGQARKDMIKQMVDMIYDDPSIKAADPIAWQKFMNKVEFSEYTVERFYEIPWQYGECGWASLDYYHGVMIDETPQSLFDAKAVADRTLKKKIMCESPNCCS